MHKTKLITCLLLIITFVGSSIANGGKQQKNGFSISLPDGWIEMPRDVIYAYEKELAKLAPNAPVQHYDYGFQLDVSKDWFEYPYILVQVKNIGRIPESQLKKLEGYPVQKSLDKHRKRFSSIMSDIQAGKMFYDKQTKMIWMSIESNVVDIGPISGISGIVPTEKGSIQVSGYSLRNDYTTYESIFRSVAMSVKPEPGLVYKPKWSDRLPSVVSSIDWGKVAGKAIAGAVIGGIAALIVGTTRRKKKDSKQSN